MPTATKIQDLGSFLGEAAHYELSEPLEGHVHVVVSAVDVPHSGPETYIFGASPDGQVIEWGELDGSFRGGLDHRAALSGAGYSITEGE